MLNIGLGAKASSIIPTFDRIIPIYFVSDDTWTSQEKK